MLITEVTRGLRTLFTEIGNRRSFFSGREELSVEFIEFGEPLDTPDGCGKGSWTPRSAALEKVSAEETDLGILRAQVMKEPGSVWRDESPRDSTLRTTSH